MGLSVLELCDAQPLPSPSPSQGDGVTLSPDDSHRPHRGGSRLPQLRGAEARCARAARPADLTSAEVGRARIEASLARMEHNAIRGRRSG